MNSIKIIILIALLSASTVLLGQENLKIKDASNNVLMEIRKEGVLIPRVTTAERIVTNLGAPFAGLMAYDTDTQSFWLWNGTQWQEISGVGGFSGSFNDLTDVPADLADGDDTEDADADPTNEIQSLSLSGNTLSLSGANAISLPEAGGGWSLTGNAGTVEGTNFIGTTDNVPLDFRVNNTRALRFRYSRNLGDGSPGVNIIGGFHGNTIVDLDINSSIIAGGGWESGINSISNGISGRSSYSTISGGEGNSIKASGATISGGRDNLAEEFSNNGTIGGGTLNIVSGSEATVPGGRSNKALGDRSFAAGTRAQADHEGTFVWSDNTPEFFVSTGINQFLVNATGGVGINKNDPATALDVNGTVTATAFVGDGSGLTGIVGSSDNLGDHTATQNIALNDNYLSGDGENEGIFIRNDGRVGIGTNTPTANLDIWGNLFVRNPGISPDGSSVRLTSPNGFPGIELRLGDGNGGEETRWDLGLTPSGRFRLGNRTGGTTNSILYATTQGFVGINTNNPDTELDVNGTVTANAFVGDGSGLTGIIGNLGDHTATQNINLNANYLSGDGESEGIFVSHDGKVGIGTNTPDANLDISGNLFVRNPGDSPDGSYVSLTAPSNLPGIELRLGDGSGGGDTRWDLGMTASGRFRLRNRTGGISKNILYATPEGFVGINTNNPDTELDVNGTVTATAFVGDGSGLTGITANADNLGDHTATQALDLNGNDLINGSTINATAFVGDGSGLTGIPSSADNLGDHTATQALNLNDNDLINGGTINATAFVGDGSGLTGIPSSADNLGDHTATQNLDLNSNDLINGGTINATAFVGDGSGLTGIPSSADNLGDHTATQNVSLNSNYLSGDGENEGIFVSNDGKVGVGTNTPTANLDISGNLFVRNPGASPDGSSVSLTSPNFLPGISIRLGDGSGGQIARWDMRTSENGSFVLQDVTNNTNTITAKGNGNVGIGIETPTTPLAIMGNGGTNPVGITQNQMGSTSTMELTTADEAGNQATRILLRGDNNDADITFYRGARGAEKVSMYIEGTNGHVGIGTSTPAYKLDVAGDTRFSGNTRLEGDARLIGDTRLIGDVTIGSSTHNKLVTATQNTVMIAGRITEAGNVNTGDVNQYSAVTGSTKNGTGNYTVTFANGTFEREPLITVTALGTGNVNRFAVIESTTPTGFTVLIRNANGSAADAPFNFIAIGKPAP